MFSNFTVGILLGLGSGAWVYSKVYKSSGGNTKNALIVAGFAGVAAMVLIMTIMSSIF